MLKNGIMPRESKLSPRRIEAIEKQRRALELRMAGRSWSDIAKAVGYSNHTGAIAAVKVALEKTLQEPAQHYRALTLERLTRILQVYWTDMLNHDLQATDRVLRVISDMRSLLGLDAPIKEEVSISGRIEHDYRAELDSRIITLLERRAEAERFGSPDAGRLEGHLDGLAGLGEGEPVATAGAMVHLDVVNGSRGWEDS